MNKEGKRYEQVYQYLKSKMEDGSLAVGQSIPSESELCRTFSVTRTTVRTALGLLDNEGFVERSQGKPARVKSRNKSLGLLTVKGFSEAAGVKVEMRMTQHPALAQWPGELPFPLHKSEKGQQAMHFSRIRIIDGAAVMLENNWFASGILEGLGEQEFREGSFFKTLAMDYKVEITASEQELHALLADQKLAALLKLEPGHPLLQIYIRFSTSREGFFLYSRLLCNTDTYKIGNTYSL